MKYKIISLLVLIIFIHGCSLLKGKPEMAVESEVIEESVVISTNKGIIKLELYPEAAPETVANFKKLITQNSMMDLHSIVTFQVLSSKVVVRTELVLEGQDGQSRVNSKTWNLVKKCRNIVREFLQWLGLKIPILLGVSSTSVWLRRHTLMEAIHLLGASSRVLRW